MIFAREISDPLTGLVKKIDEATAQHSEAKMGSFVVLCSDDDIKDLEKQLKALADKEHIEHTVLTIDDASGPEDYHVSKEADITVVLYVHKTVKVNRAFKKGELTGQDVEEVVRDLSKILPQAE